VITLLRGIIYSFKKKLTGCIYNSDYRVEVSHIENIFQAYIDKIDSISTSRLLWRSICQYRCQMFARNTFMVLCANISALLCLPIILFYFRRNKKNDFNKDSCKYLKIDFHMAYQIPTCIKDVTLEKKISEKYLTINDLFFVFDTFIKNRVFYPELLLKYLLWIASVRPYLDSFRPAYLIQYCEYSAYSSLRKLFLNSHGIMIANVTHGEEFISCRSAFSTFDQYFSWELTPVSVHNAMHIEYSDRFSFNPCDGIDLVSNVQLTPTLGFLWPSLEGADLNVIVQQLNNLSNYGKVLVRPHPDPKYTNHFESYRCVLNAEISDPKEEDIHCFIDHCDIMAGYLSAALLQAAFRGRDVLYLHNSYLDSLMGYHNYYKKVKYVDIEHLSDYVMQRWIKMYGN